MIIGAILIIAVPAMLLIWGVRRLNAEEREREYRKEHARIANLPSKVRERQYPYWPSHIRREEIYEDD